MRIISVRKGFLFHWAAVATSTAAWLLPLWIPLIPCCSLSAVSKLRKRIRTRTNLASSPSSTPFLGVERIPNNTLTVSRNVQTTLDPCVVLMKAMISKYAHEWKDRGGIFSLAQGVVYWKPPDAVQTALIRALSRDDGDLHLYGPDEGLNELRDVLRHKIAVENGLTHHDVMVTMGANQAYVNCVLTLLNPNQDYAVVFAPYYFNHVMALQMTLSSDRVLVGPVDETTGQPDVAWLAHELNQSSKRNIGMVTLVNPGNPTGIALTKAQVQPLVDLCRQQGVWLVLDATYEYFVHDDTLTVSTTSKDTVSTVPSNAFNACFADEHCLHIFSLSKAYALAGYRCGYLALSKEQASVFDHMLKVQDTIPIAPSRVAQIAALAAIQHAGPQWVHEQVATLHKGRTAIRLVLEKHVDTILGGSGAMYVMGQLPTKTALPMDDVAVAERLVGEFGVAVIPGSYCGFPGWLRVCYANLPPDLCVQAAQRLDHGLEVILSSG